MQNIAIPSLSYDPATDLLMYPGTIEMKAAATRPADSSYKQSRAELCGATKLFFYLGETLEKNG